MMDSNNTNDTSFFVIGIRFKNSGKIYDFKANGFSMRVGDRCVVETDKGLEFGIVSIAQNKIHEKEIKMKLVKVDFSFDAQKAIFYYTSEERVDFRELVKDLAHHFKIKIEMRQIGLRDEAKMIGGCGPCGRNLCCTSFLKEFEPVSIKMAKDQ